MRSGPVRWIVVLVLGLLAGAALVDRIAPSRPTGVPSSSFASQPQGLAAYHDVLRRAGHRVRRVRIAPSERAPARDETLVILDAAGLGPDDAEAVLLHVTEGGRLLAGGRAAGAWIEDLVGAAEFFVPEGRPTLRARPLVAAGDLAPVGIVESAGEGLLRSTAGALPLFGTGAGALVVGVTRGRGRAFVMADASPLQNRGLDRADNAALGLALAGSTRDGRPRPVAFLETVHGYGRQTGLAALPPRWRFTLAGLLLAGLVFTLARGRRIGAPEEPEVDWPPARAVYVDALAASLERADRPGEAAEPLRAAARVRIARRAQLGPEPTGEALARAAEQLGLDAEERAALEGGEGESALIAAARALTRT